MSSPPQSRTLRTNLTSAAVERLRWPPVLAIALVWATCGVLTAAASAATSGAQRLHEVTNPVSRAERAATRGPSRPGAAPSASRREIPLLTPDPAQLRRAKARAAKRLPDGAAPSPRTFAPQPRATVFGGLNKPGMAAEGNRTPPDTTGAIGPNHYVEFVNGTGITAYDRNLDPVSGPVPLENFVGFPSDNVFDPQIQWDEDWGRWIYVMDDVEEVEIGPGEFEVNNFLAFGWSKTADPSNLTTEEPGEGAGAGWCGYFIPTGAEFDDYPKLGHSDDGITIGTNVFALEAFVTSRIWSIAKPPSPAGCPPAGELSVEAFGSAVEPLKTEDGDTVFTPVPANTADSSPDSYVVAADFPGGDPEIMGWHVSGAGEGATLVEDGNMEVGPYGFPANVPQPGTAEVLDSLDSRLTNAVAVTDPAVGEEAVWTQHTVNGPGGRSVVRWYELLPGAETPTVRQEGTISDPSHFVFNGAISPTAQGDAAAINFNRGSSTLLPEMRAQSREASTPLGTMTGDVLLGESAGVAQDFSCGGASEPCRWGDYAGASPDPVVPGVVWGSNQGLGAPIGKQARWTTRNFALVADETAPAAPTISGSDPPSPADNNNPKLKGTAEAGSTVRLYKSADCSGPVTAQGSAAAFAAPGIAVTVPDNSTTQFTATATDEVGNTSTCSTVFAYTEVPPPPAPEVGSGPAPPPPPPPPGTAIASKLALVKGGAALLRMRCLGAGPCRGVARLVVRVKAPKGAKSSKKRARNVVIGKAGFSIAAGKSKVVRVALTGLGKALVRKAGKRGVRAKLRGKGLVPRAVQLKPPARKRK